MSSGTDVVQIDKLSAVLISGDLKSLSQSERVSYNHKVCASLGLNPLTNPFEYITLNGKLRLYAKKDCTDQLRRIYSVSVEFTETKLMNDVFMVKARATTPTGRIDESWGAVGVAGLKGEQLANAMMKAETKAKRRVTLSICGLGVLDESELENIRDAERTRVSSLNARLVPEEMKPLIVAAESMSPQATPPGHSKPKSDVKPEQDLNLKKSEPEKPNPKPAEPAEEYQYIGPETRARKADFPKGADPKDIGRFEGMVFRHDEVPLAPAKKDPRALNPGDFQVPENWGRHGGKRLSQLSTLEARAYLSMLEKKQDIDEPGKRVLFWLKQYCAQKT